MTTTTPALAPIAQPDTCAYCGCSRRMPMSFPNHFSDTQCMRALRDERDALRGVLAQIAALPRFDLRYEERAGQPSVKQLPHVDGGYTDAAALHALLDAGGARGAGGGA